jgi:hypothetical protein
MTVGYSEDDIQAQVDPRETLRRVLYDSGLDDVRSVLEQLPSSSLIA